MELFYFPFIVFVAAPPLGLVPAAFFGACARRQDLGRSSWDRRLLMVGAGSWLVYTVYECGIWIWSQGVTAPIRVDLLFIAPMLDLASALGLRAWWRTRQRGREDRRA